MTRTRPPQLNETHDPALRSWVVSANPSPAVEATDTAPAQAATVSDFPLQNLPYAIFRRSHTDARFRAGVAIGDQVLDLAAHAVHQALKLDAGTAAALMLSREDAALNALMALGPAAWSALRLALSRGLRAEAPHAVQAVLQAHLTPQAEVEYALPAHIGDYTDFYTSIHHATNVGRLFRPDNPLLPNYKWVPIGYHGRSSSIGVSGQQFRRPRGQLMAPGADPATASPTLAPTQRLDIELELGIFIGQGNALGEPVPLVDAEDHVFGLCLLNDWSARDMQAWEYQPLGPFLAKNFATTISPWIVTLEALAPYRTAFTRPASDPQPLPYLDSAANREAGAFDIQLEVLIQTGRMRQAGQPAHRIVRTSYRHAYWTLAQLVTHHTVGGCNLQPGDLFGSGTLSGPTPEEAGALLELTRGGKQPLSLPDGEQRTFLHDGDSVTLHGYCEKAGAARIGFGDCTGTVLPAKA
ncbi:fumarylacetoacetase [Hylemonella gracilis]|uniref:fumarylacetoacetase n=1 Tax=Hylemonella gracilis TaxID=80880 RepID=A0A4P6UH80_9BURK|nr:fumarylacetoacetase [Hylemonella gracilis]QBK03420.1 fumarylacetoacetase [Hylemonella gracilis]